MIGIVIPACNEEAHLETCLQAVLQAIQYLPNKEGQVGILVVLDSCTDRSLNIVKRAGIKYVQCNVRFS